MHLMFNDVLITGDDSKLEAWEKLTGAPTGYSVGRTAKILGMTRQSVTKAIHNDALQATRIYMQTKKGKTLISTEVDRDSVHAYAQAREGRQRVPQGFKATQRLLPL